MAALIQSICMTVDLVNWGYYQSGSSMMLGAYMAIVTVSYARTLPVYLTEGWTPSKVLSSNAFMITEASQRNPRLRGERSGKSSVRD